MESLEQIINDELSSYSYIQSYSNMCISKTDVDLNSLLEPGNYYCNLTNDQDGSKYHFPEGSSCILQVVRSNLNGFLFVNSSIVVVLLMTMIINGILDK